MFNKPVGSLTLLFVSFQLFSQLEEWTPPFPLTDSLSDNRNAIVMDLNFYDSWGHYVFWEKSFNTSSTHIYTKSYYAQDEPVALVEGDYHNIEPCILRIVDQWYSPPNDTSFYLFYLSDRDGDYDIYYRIYTVSGMSEEFLFAHTPGNEKHLQSNCANSLTWEYEGEIRSVLLRKETGGYFYFTDIKTAGSGNCKNPVLEPVAAFDWGQNFLAYEKVINDSSKVMLCTWDYAMDTWSAPEIVFDTGSCTNLKFEESSWSQVAPTLSWDLLDASGQRKIVSFDPWYMDYFMLDLDQQLEYMPTVFNIFVGVSDIWFFALLSFVKEENGQTDIYGGFQEAWWPDSYTNLSASSAVETNPHLWNGNIYYDYQHVINIWESNRSGHWQLYTSKIDVPLSGGVDERNQNNTGLLQVSPNPFTDQLTVTFKSEITGKASVILYDYLGRQVSTLLEPEIQKGDQSWMLDPGKITGRELPLGIYFIRLEAEGMNFSVKLIKSGD